MGQDGTAWVPRDELLTIPWESLSPVTLVVLDAETGAPIPEFTYEYWISSPEAKFDPMLVRPIPVKSPDGSFTIQAPPTCQISIRVEGKDLIGGYGTLHTYNLMSDNEDRRIEVGVWKGVTVRGTVTDAETGEPVQGARVSPLVFTAPLFSPDTRRSVETGAEGSFAVHGVDWDLGISVSHLDYLESRASEFEAVTEEAADGSHVVDVELRAGATLFGKVEDPAGNPIADVSVSDGAGKAGETGEDGTFVLKSPRKWWGDHDAYSLSFKKDGYVSKTLHPTSADPEGLSVVLWPCPTLKGTVIDPDGRPVPAYRIFAGPEPEPRSWQCTSQQINDPEGRFSLPIPEGRDYAGQGQCWVGVAAPGYAVWDGLLDGWEGTRTITIQLDPGVTVTGQVTLPEAQRGGVTVRILPDRKRRDEYDHDLTQGQIIRTIQTGLDAGGAFRFDHVCPGPYILSAYGPAITPIGVGIAVPEEGLNVGALSPRGTGTVFGQVLRPKGDDGGGVWPFAAAAIEFSDSSGRSFCDESPHLKPIPFTADESGRFRVDGVPAGHVAVSILFNVSADWISAHARNAVVLEGKATEVRFYDPSGEWDVTFEIVVGDGSPAQYSTGTGLGAERTVDNVNTREPMFMVALSPMTEEPTSYPSPDWERLDDEHRIVLPDVHPGTYSVRVIDWLMSRGFGEGLLHEESVSFRPGSRTMRVRLGGGCITGQVTWSRDYRHMIHVVAVGKKGRPPSHARCDDGGNFCVRYLPADDYELYAHDYEAGWASWGEVSLRDAVQDVGTHQLRAGATIEGQIALAAVAALATEVVATDRRGISVDAPDFSGGNGAQYAISGLWPGAWQVALRRNGSALATANVHLEGTETVTVNLRAEGPEAVRADSKPNEMMEGSSQ